MLNYQAVCLPINLLVLIGLVLALLQEGGHTLDLVGRLEAAAEEYEANHQPPAPAAAPEVVPVSLEQVRTVLARLSQAGHTAQVRELIQAAGASKLSEVDPSKFGRLLEQAEAIADA